MDNYYGMKQNYLHVTLHPTHYTTKNILKICWMVSVFSHFLWYQKLFLQNTNFERKTAVLLQISEICFKFEWEKISKYGIHFIIG